MDVTKKSLAEELAETIIAEIKEEEDLRCLDAFRDLHEYCDANILGDSEAYLDKYGCEVVIEAQQLVEAQMPFVEQCRYCGFECEIGVCVRCMIEIESKP